MIRQWTPALGCGVYLRPEPSSDQQVWADTFTGLYHLPPSEMPEPSTVLDLGANIGLTAAHYRSLWPDVAIVAVEMDADCCDLIRVNAPAVVVREHAVSGRGGIGVYNHDLRAEAYAFVQPGPDDTQAVLNNRPVMSYTLRKTILRSFPHRPTGPPTPVDFVKMDVEGEEWSLFDYGEEWSPLVRHLLVELHGDGGSEALVARAIAALGKLGFQARHHLPHPQAVYAWR